MVCAELLAPQAYNVARCTSRRPCVQESVPLLVTPTFPQLTSVVRARSVLHQVLSCAVVVVSVSWALGKRLVKCKRPLAKKQGRHSPRTLSGKSHRGVTSSSGIASAERLQMLEDLEAQRFIDESERLAQATLPSRSNARIHPVRLKSADSSSQSLAGEDLEFGAGFSDPPSLRGALDSPKRAFCSIRSALSGAASAAYDDGHDRNVENDAGDIGASNLDVESEVRAKSLYCGSSHCVGCGCPYGVTRCSKV